MREITGMEQTAVAIATMSRVEVGCPAAPRFSVFGSRIITFGPCAPLSPGSVWIETIQNWQQRARFVGAAFLYHNPRMHQLPPALKTRCLKPRKP
jgi:hypothetical protein